jgi:hypothetical protein
MNKDLAAIAVPKDGVYTIEVSTRPVFSITTPDPIYRWHLRFGHADYKSVSQVIGVPRMKPPPCFPGKQTRKRSKKRQIRDFIALWVAAKRDLLPVTITFWSSWMTTRGTYGFGSLSRKTK